LIHLPDEIIVMILNFLKTQTLVNLSKLCRQIIPFTVERCVKEHRTNLDNILKEWRETISYSIDRNNQSKYTYTKLQNKLDTLRRKRKEETLETYDGLDMSFNVVYDHSYEEQSNRLSVCTFKGFKFENNMWYDIHHALEITDSKYNYYIRYTASKYRIIASKYKGGTSIDLIEELVKVNEDIPPHFDEYDDIAPSPISGIKWYLSIMFDVHNNYW
jgi:hypothetical protein